MTPLTSFSLIQEMASEEASGDDDDDGGAPVYLCPPCVCTVCGERGGQRAARITGVSPPPGTVGRGRMEKEEEEEVEEVAVMVSNKREQRRRCPPRALCSVVSRPCSGTARARCKTLNGFDVGGVVGGRPPPASCHIVFPSGVFW